MSNNNPASVIREALAKVLVFYYPFAGRLKEGLARKLMVDCSGQGVLFVEAEADVTLQQFGDPPFPPFPCIDELIYEVPGSSGILDTPLLIIQVTRLSCGGFIIGVRENHTISDAKGFTQFMTALAEIVRGASKPSILPVWERNILLARDPPRITCTHHAYDERVDTTNNIIPPNDMECKTFFFGSAEMSAIRRLLPVHLKNRSTFEVLTACLWRCRTIALQLNPKDDVRMIFPFDTRKLGSFIPLGYYGNAVLNMAAISTAGELSNKPLSHALNLVSKAKLEVSEEYVRSLADLMVIKDRPCFTTVRSYMVSDLTRAEMDVVDFGWGKAEYGGPILGGLGYFSFYFNIINNKGEPGIMVPIYLPSATMKIFVQELNSILVQDNQVLKDHKPRTTSSKL